LGKAHRGAEEWQHGRSASHKKPGKRHDEEKAAHDRAPRQMAPIPAATNIATETAQSHSPETKSV
jgi:hypothetical protein